MQQQAQMQAQQQAQQMQMQAEQQARQPHPPRGGRTLDHAGNPAGGRSANQFGIAA